MMETQERSMLQAPRSLLLIAEVPAEPIAEIRGQGSWRHSSNRATMPSSAKEPHSISSDVPPRLFLSNVCIQAHKIARRTQDISLSTNTPRKWNNKLLGPGMFLRLPFTLFKYSMKGRERWTSKKAIVFCNVCITQVLWALEGSS